MAHHLKNILVSPLFYSIIILFTLPKLRAQNSTDTIETLTLPEVTVQGSYTRIQEKKTPLTVMVVKKEFLKQNFNGNLMQTLQRIPGINSMDIGAGFSKPMIRGLGFNRIVVAENGIKHEAQQWGSDHGLEIDAFNIDEVNILKGPASLQYGSDAIGGAIEIVPPTAPIDNQFFGEAALLLKSNNASVGGSLMLGYNKNNWFIKARYTEQHYGDYHIPTDTVVYLTLLVPIYNHTLKNTAGFERNASLFTSFSKNSYKMNFSVSNTYQKMGFFPGAHGIPDISRVTDDGNSRNIGLPYSWVNHFKTTTHQEYVGDSYSLSADLGYQYNHREEWSLFHTHYDNQPLPETNPNQEFVFKLQTYNAVLKANLIHASGWNSSFGIDGEYQHNTIGGFSFLLPKYNRFLSGIFAMTTYKPSHRLNISGGLRYDFGWIRADAYQNPYLEEYLTSHGYTQNEIDKYQWRSYAINRKFNDYSGSIGIVWSPSNNQMLKWNIGRSFRLPGANELASNGVHHGTFSHEQGDPTLHSEHGWQMDLFYNLNYKKIAFSIAPYINWFDNYISLSPTGEWSILPHAGQIYRYKETTALLTGCELSFTYNIGKQWRYDFIGTYIYTYDFNEQTVLCFSPPANMRNTLTWHWKGISIYAEAQSIATQNLIARNEEITSGATLLNMGYQFSFPKIDIALSAYNLINTKYFNHLSFYRKMEIPEPGRNFQCSIKVPFKFLIK